MVQKRILSFISAHIKQNVPPWTAYVYGKTKLSSIQNPGETVDLVSLIVCTFMEVESFQSSKVLALGTL